MTHSFVDETGKRAAETAWELRPEYYAKPMLESAQRFMSKSEELPSERSSTAIENREILDEQLPLVYDELRRLAGSFLNREHAVSIQTTELVHEAYFRLSNQHSVDWRNRRQFFALAAQAMRRILIDAARSRRSHKRGVEKVRIEDAPNIPVHVDEHLLELDRALTELSGFDPAQCSIVELRYFGGLTIEQTAEVLSISPATVKREWSIARAWLYDRVNRD